ncbi:MAG: hypothetical protein GY835_18645, partial [bacterium]|nr:hypothetical protein [bacterium]
MCGRNGAAWAGRVQGVFRGSPTEYEARIRETYTYGGKGGRVSKRVLDLILYAEGSAEDLAAEEFTQSWTYDDMGGVDRVRYPRCTVGFAKCYNDTGGGWRAVTNTYTRGYLTAVAGYASAISYHDNGLVHQIAHTNGITVTQATDPNGLARPASITATFGAQTRWTTGDYG